MSNRKLAASLTVWVAVAAAGTGGCGSNMGMMGTGGSTGTAGSGSGNRGGGSGNAGTTGGGGTVGTAGTTGGGGTTGVAGTGGGTTGVAGATGSGGSVGTAGTAGQAGAGGRGGVGGTGVACLPRDIDVPNGIITGTIKIGGATVSSQTDYGNLTLRNMGNTDEVLLGTSYSAAYSVRIVPGTYNLIYKTVASSTATPKNVLGTARTGVVVATAGTTALDIDVPVVTVSGMFTIGGVAVPTATDSGLLFLRTAAGDEVALGQSAAGSYLVRALPGTYDLHYRVATPGATAPRNMNARLRTGITLATSGTTSLDIDVPSAILTGTIKIGGVAAPSTADSGTLLLRNAAGDEISVGSTTAATYTIRVVPGSYDLYYRMMTAGATAPKNINARLMAGVTVAATGTTTLDVDVPTAVISGSIKIGGATVTSTADSGTLSLRNTAGDEVSLGPTYSGSYSARVVPGVYDVYYRSLTPGTFAPRNTAAKLMGVVVAATGTTVLDVDVPTVVVTGMMKIAGATVSSATDYGALSLRTAAGDTVALGNTSAGSYSVRVVPGTYDVHYRFMAGGTLAPRNTNAKIRTGVAVGASGTTALDIDVPATLVSGSVKIGGTMVTSTADYGTLLLRGEKDDEAVMGTTYSPSYMIRMVPGTYDLVYRVTLAGTLAPRNTGARLGCYTIP
jgi:hypothetical protein